MRLSELEDYLKAVPAAVAGDFAAAKKHFLVCISLARTEKDIETLAYLLQCLGDVEAQTNEFETARALHEEAVELTPSSPLTLLFYAKSLLRVFGSPDAALAKLVEVETLINSSQWNSGESDMSREWYEKEITGLRKQIEP